MSDTTDTKTRDENAQPVEASTLFAGLSINPAFQDRVTGTETISGADAVAILAKRYGKVLGYRPHPDQSFMEDITTSIIGGNDEKGWLDSRFLYGAIVSSLPESMRTKAALEALDIRPYLMAIGGADVVTVSGRKLDLNGLGVNYEKIQKKITESIDKSFEANPTATAAEKEAMKKASLNPTSVGAAPEADSVAASQQAGVDITGANPVDPNAGKLSKADVRALVSQYLWDGTGTGAFQAGAKLLTAEESGKKIDVAMDAGRRSRLRNTQSPSLVGKAQGTTTAHGAFNYLMSQDPEAVMVFQRNLQDSGIYDIVGQQVTDHGEATDQATVAAFDWLMIQSATTGKSMLQIMQDTGKDYWAKKEQAIADTTGSAYGELSMNNYAQKIIGRDLTDLERQMLAGYMVKLAKAGKTTSDEYTQRANDPLAGASMVDVANFAKENLPQESVGLGLGSAVHSAKSYYGG